MIPEENETNHPGTSAPPLAAFPENRPIPKGLGIQYLIGFGLVLVIVAGIAYYFGIDGLRAREKERETQAILDRNTELTHAVNYAQANQILEHEIQKDPKNAALHNELSWNLSTSPQSQMRDGARAVKEATQACELSGWVSGPFVDSLAAAYAEMGDFKSAANWQQYALSLPNLAPEYEDEFKERLGLYQRGQVYHEK